MRMGLREVVGVEARRQLVSERGEGDDQVDGTPDGRAQRALGRPGICGGGEHVFAKLIGLSDGSGANACSRPGCAANLALERGICGLLVHAILQRAVQVRAP